MRVRAAPHTPSDVSPTGPLLLRDGTVVTVRVAGPDDRPALRRFFHELSPESRWLRFFSMGEPSDSVIANQSEPFDPARGVTLLATRTSEGTDRILGVTSYQRIDAKSAEAAFAVDDRFAGKGIATALLERMAMVASEAGFERFTATTLPENAAMLGVFRDSGFTIRSKASSGAVEVELSLAPSSETLVVREERERIAAAASIRPLLAPESVVIVGVSRRPENLGRRVYDAAVAARFTGRLYAVNPNLEDINGTTVYKSVRDLPAPVDLAVIAVPRGAVLATVEDCAAAHVKSLVIVTAGFAESGDEGRRLQTRVLETVRGHGLRMIGPNCMGVLNTSLRLNASFSPVFPPEGSVAFSSQSGALGLAILALAAERQIGLSTFVSVGNKADVSGNDLLQYWEGDPATSVILLYLESFGNPRKFARLARRIGRKKPIIVIKAGRSAAGSRAAGSHTAALAANETVVDALFRQAGVIRAETINEMFDLAACLSTQPLPAGRRVAVITNAGGPGILAADACEGAGLSVVTFSQATRERLSQVLSSMASLGNPVDMVASAGADDYRRCIEIALSAEEVDALIVIHTPVDTFRSSAIVSGIRDGVAASRRHGAAEKPVLACLMAEAGRPHPIEASGERIPAYSFPENAARALGKMARYAGWRAQPPGLSWGFNDLRPDDARAVCRDVVSRRGADWLNPEEVGRVLTAFGLPVTPNTIARTSEEAAALASVMGFPVVAKLVAKSLVHKSDIGGVRLNLTSPQAVQHAFNDLMTRAREQALTGVDGVLVQPMIPGTEVIVGLVEDPHFGPIIGVGLGGADVELLGDMHFRLAPLTDRDIEDLFKEMRTFPLLDGYRGRPRADVDALSEVILRISRLAEDIPEIVELDLNPVMVLAAQHGCRIVDARIRVGGRIAS